MVKEKKKSHVKVRPPAPTSSLIIIPRVIRARICTYRSFTGRAVEQAGSNADNLYITGEGGRWGAVAE